MGMMSLHLGDAPSVRGYSSILLRWQECTLSASFQEGNIAHHHNAASIGGGKVAHLLQCALPGCVREVTNERVHEIGGLEHVPTFASSVQHAFLDLHVVFCRTWTALLTAWWVT